MVSRLIVLLTSAALVVPVWAQSGRMTSTDAFNAGAEFANTGKSKAVGAVNSTTGTSNLPYYSTTAPESAKFQGGRNPLGGSGTAKQIECQSSKAATAFQQQECDAVNFLVQNPSKRKQYTITKNDPLIARSVSIMNDPTKYAPGLNGSSTECTDRVTMSPAIYSKEFCDQWLTPEDKICDVTPKVTLDKDVMYSCRVNKLATSYEQCSSVKYSNYRIDSYRSATRVPLTCGGDPTIQSWYRSYGNRCADVDGMAYWQWQLSLAGGNYSAIFPAFYQGISTETTNISAAFCYSGGVYLGWTECQYDQVVMSPTYECTSLSGQSSGGSNEMTYTTLIPLNCGGDPVIQSWYRTYDSRCADAEGMAYWQQQLAANGGNYSAIFDAWQYGFMRNGGRGASWLMLCNQGDEYVFNSTTCRRRIYTSNNACRKLSSTCVDSTPTKYFGGVPVSVSQVGGCWEYRDSFECTRTADDSSCNSLATLPTCKQVSTACESTAFNGSCQTEKRTYRCEDASMPNPSGATNEGLVGEITNVETDVSQCKPYAENAECGQVQDVCVEPKTTKVIDGVSVYQDCWRWQRKYTCYSGSYSEDCQRLVNKGCEKKGGSCLDKTPTGRCALEQSEYSCKERDGAVVTVKDCGTQMLCAPGGDGKQQCFDTGYPPDADFGTAAVMMEAAREAGVYFDSANLRIFKGVDERCKKKLFGLANCCKKGGGGSAKTNNNIMGNIVGQGIANAVGYTKEVGSKYMYDFMYSTEIPWMQEKALDAMALSGGFFDDYTVPATGFDPKFSLYGLTVTTGSMPATGLMGAPILEVGQIGSFNFYFDPYSLALTIAMQMLTELLSCDQSEQMLGMHRDSRLCVAAGSYCSSRVPVIKTCIEKTESYCCFNSRLARLINEQGRIQLGRGWGAGEAPDCSGFTPDELQRLDFSKIDFSEFIEEIMAAVKLPDTTALGAKIQQTVVEKTKNYYDQ